MSRPYDNIDAEQLQRDADDDLLPHGTTFHPEIITSSDGIYIETASGHRIWMYARICTSHIRLIRLHDHTVHFRTDVHPEYVSNALLHHYFRLQNYVQLVMATLRLLLSSMTMLSTWIIFLVA
jgi:hypothetical protein